MSQKRPETKPPRERPRYVRPRVKTDRERDRYALEGTGPKCNQPVDVCSIEQ
jgi:hypothetical protein